MQELKQENAGKNKAESSCPFVRAFPGAAQNANRREVFLKAPEGKAKLWGGEFWGKRYFVNTAGQHGSEKVIAEYLAFAVMKSTTAFGSFGASG